MLIVYQTGKQFIECNEAIFRNYPLETLLFLNVAQKMTVPSEGFVVKVIKGSTFLMAIQYMNLPMVLYGDDTLCAELAIGLYDNALTFNRVVANQSLSDSFLQAYQKFSGGTHMVVGAMDIMLCRQLNKIETDSAESALPEDTKEISTILTKFNKEAIQPAGNIKYNLRTLKADIGCFVLIRQDGKIVALGKKGKENKWVCDISHIYTDESFRRKGLAQKILMNLTQSVLRRRKTAYALLDHDDIGSKQLYEKAGYTYGIPQIEMELVLDTENG